MLGAVVSVMAGLVPAIHVVMPENRPALNPATSNLDDVAPKRGRRNLRPFAG
jgi:hypothetical protein